ncbi:tail fiber assembly protein [Yersinia intermedia]|uniref:Tail fiber assembly protein n=1 Tax=Yersinia intermedia TaxID=631 RepID=A0ABX6FDR8_YERIN|nr:tail fiber assembly protein [Yersinia intermedia]QGR67045.1 tail fiber assembly protein [Yersinia intermedia]QGR72061.1 tail fiber assembly protein [Yersinia intermedia]
MNKYLYDAVTNAFYPLAMQEDYEAAGMWPKIGVEVDEDLFASFQNPAPGKIRVPGKDGYPAWGDIPPPSDDQLLAMAEAEKQSRIADANDYMNSKQWPGKAAMGRLKVSEKAQYNLWLDYLDALEAVDTSTVPDVWPLAPE